MLTIFTLPNLHFSLDNAKVALKGGLSAIDINAIKGVGLLSHDCEVMWLRQLPNVSGALENSCYFHSPLLEHICDRYGHTAGLERIIGETLIISPRLYTDGQ
jgi:hypothetical protein